MNSNLFFRVSFLRFGGTHARSRDFKEFYNSSTKREHIVPAQQEFIAPFSRAWSASELRLKSFSDLHKLWFVLLKEKNVLLTERLRARQAHEHWPLSIRLVKVKLGMKRIKLVLGERAKVYQEAQRLIRNHITKEEQKSKLARIASVRKARNKEIQTKLTQIYGKTGTWLQATKHKIQTSRPPTHRQTLDQALQFQKQAETSKSEQL